MKLNLLIDGHQFNHGDYVAAELYHGSEDEGSLTMVLGRLCFNDDETFEEHDDDEPTYRFWICQDSCDGCSEAEETFGYQYSWTARVNLEGKIVSHDTKSIRPHSLPNPLRQAEPVACTPCTEHLFQTVELDDDPMPEDWVVTEKIPKNL